jgi:hypothetical protein
MRIRTRLAFVFLLAAGTFFVAQTNQVVLAACEAPGLVGMGGTESLAISDCNTYGQSHCSALCNTHCGVAGPENWTSLHCDIVGCNGTPQTCTATGYCNCVGEG